MKNTLKRRLENAKKILDKVDDALTHRGSNISLEVKPCFQDVAEFRKDIDPHWFNLLEAREAASSFISNLETRVVDSDYVLYGEMRISYQTARFLGVVSYLTPTWALADQLSYLCALVLCTRSIKFKREPINLVRNFIQRENATKNLAATLSESLRRTFGWPIGICYAIRNHFLHDGAWAQNTNIFKGFAADSAFQISDDGWETIESAAKIAITGKKGEQEEFDSKDYWQKDDWPFPPKSDLRKTLILCQQEMDDALGILLGSACGTLHTHLGFMLGEDE